jgi:hypothetical protein
MSATETASTGNCERHCISTTNALPATKPRTSRLQRKSLEIAGFIKIIRV